MTAVASIGPGLPQELFTATGTYTGPVIWDLDRPTPDADRWLESKFPLWARLILQQWADGDFDALDMVVFSRADDAAQRLYYYVCELQRTGALSGPEPFLLDIAKVPRPSSLHHTLNAVRALADRLSVGAPALEKAIAALNLERSEGAEQAGQRTCLLAGTPPPDHRLHDTIERAGFRALGPTLKDSWRDPGPLVEEGTADPFRAVAQQLQVRRDDQRGFEDHAATTADRARRLGASAAILWYTEEDESRVWNAPATQAALTDLNIPVRLFARRDWAARDGTIDQISVFLRGIAK